MSEVREQAEQSATELRTWYDAYRFIGFTSEQAMQLLTRPQVVISQPSSPEMSEFMTKMTSWLNQGLAE